MSGRRSLAAPARPLGVDLPADATATDRELLATARDRVLSRCRERRAAGRDDELYALVRADETTGTGDDREPTYPCGTCRDAIAAVGGPDVTVLATCLVRRPDGWTLFPTVERRRVGELVPDRWTDPWG